MIVRPAAMALAMLAQAACARDDRPGASSAGPGAPRVVVETRAGARLPVTVEIARTEPARARGLMFRSALPADTGMLFIFDETEEHPFWMKNTLIPLDMIFIDDTGRVTGVVASAVPGSLAPRSGGESRFVLEVNGGWADAHGVRAGDRVRFDGVPFP